MFLFYKLKVSDFDRMVQYVKDLEKENKMLLNQNSQLKEELKKLKSNFEHSDRGLDQSRLVRQLSDYIELIKPSKPRSALTSHKTVRDHGHEQPQARDQHQPAHKTSTSQLTKPRTRAAASKGPAPASSQNIDKFVCHKGKDDLGKKFKIIGG